MKVFSNARQTVFAAMLVAAGTGTVVLAQDAPIVKIDEIDCRTMLKMDGDEQDYTLLYLHGYISGEKKALEFNGPAFREATNKVMDDCIDHPSEKLITVLGKYR